MTRGTDIVDTKRRNGYANLARLGSALAGLLLVGFLVISGSAAAFLDTTDNTGSSFAAGDVELVDDDSGTVMFNVTNMEPGNSVTKCIMVTYQGSITDPSPVKIYSGGYTDSGDFANYLNLTIEEGSGGSFADCTGFTLGNAIETGGTIADFNISHTNYANGAGVWDPSTTPQSKTYRVTVELDANTPSSEQGESVSGLTFTWEVQN